VTRTVLHVIDTWGPGGAETVCVELASGLDRARWRPCSAVIREGWVHDRLRTQGLDPTIVRTGRGPVDLGYLAGLLRLARRKQVSLIQSHLLTANLYSAMVGRLLGIPVIATFHGTVDVGQRDRAAGLKLGLIARSAARLVFVSESLRRHFMNRRPVDLARTSVVHNGIDVARFGSSQSAALRTEMGMTDSDIIVGAVGNIREWKGYDQLLRVAHAVRDSRPMIRFVVAGRELQPLYGRLLAIGRELGLEDRVRFLGYREDAVSIFNSLDIYLNTSVSEGFSLTTVQAMACGIPVVATRSGGPEEIVTDGVDGLLVPVGDTAAIASALTRLASDAALRRRLGDAGRRTAVARFSVQRMVRDYEAIYDEVLRA
jgi:glycosyltransferase involved in cell wall biosynthesis